MNEAGKRWLQPASRLSRCRQRSGSAAVIRTIERGDLRTTGVRARDLEGGFVCLGSTVGKEKYVDVAGRDAGQLCTQPRARLGCKRRRDVSEQLRLLVNRVDDPSVSVAEVHA